MKPSNRLIAAPIAIAVALTTLPATLSAGTGKAKSHGAAHSQTVKATDGVVSTRQELRKKRLKRGEGIKRYRAEQKRLKELGYWDR